jgi:HAD superfamily hydrolase (TIGR01490 family)
MKPACPGRVAAFFDLDGTLLAAPSLERRLFRTLRYRRAIRLRNLFSWLTEAIRLAPRGIASIAQANKMYLRGVRVSEGELTRGALTLAEVRTHSRDGHLRASLPPFFPEAIDRVAWHASEGHPIVLVSGTLQPLAEEAARRIESQVAKLGIVAEIHVIATRLEEAAGSWTGRLLGPAIFGEEKARAVRRLAVNWGLELETSYAYGDTAHDRWMLAAVGRPTAVNPSEELARIARLHGWPEMRWKKTGSNGSRSDLREARTIEAAGKKQSA